MQGISIAKRQFVSHHLTFPECVLRLDKGLYEWRNCCDEAWNAWQNVTSSSSYRQKEQCWRALYSSSRAEVPSSLCVELVYTKTNWNIHRDWEPKTFTLHSVTTTTTTTKDDDVERRHTFGFRFYFYSVRVRQQRAGVFPYPAVARVYAGITRGGLFRFHTRDGVNDNNRSLSTDRDKIVESDVLTWLVGKQTWWSWV